MRKKITLLIISSLCVLNLLCWKKQQHEILAPKTPVYQVYGTVIGSFHHQPIEGSIVTISGSVTYIGEDTMTVILSTDTSNANGRFEFNNIPGANQYTIEVRNQGYETLYIPIMTYYEDKEVKDVVLGLYLTEETKHTISDHHITGIEFANGKLWLITLEKELIELGTDLSIQSSTTLHQIFPTALAWDGETFWSVDTVRHALNQFNIDSMGQVEYNNSFALPVDSAYSEQPIDFIDLTWSDEGALYGCSPTISRKVCRFIPENIEEFSLFLGPEEMYYSVGVANDPDNLYLACHYQLNQRLYILDKNNQEELAYLVFPEIADKITWDGNAIWMAKDHTLLKYTF